MIRTGGFDVQYYRDSDGLVWVKLPGYGLMGHEHAVQLAADLRDAATRAAAAERADETPALDPTRDDEPMSEQPLGLAEVRRGLQTVVQPSEHMSERQHEIASRSLTAAALLLLLPSTPVEGRHTVDDIPPRQDGLWTLGDWVIKHDPNGPGFTRNAPIAWKQGSTTWLTTVEEAEEFAAVLLSAAARVRARQETDRG